VPRYRYRCPADGAFDLSFTMGSAPSSVECRTCCGTSTRVYAFGAVLPSDPVGSRILDLHAQSQSSPTVVRRTGVAGDSSTLRYADPRHRNLPTP
jgi:hypothetical protein